MHFNNTCQKASYETLDHYERVKFISQHNTITLVIKIIIKQT